MFWQALSDAETSCNQILSKKSGGQERLEIDLSLIIKPTYNKCRKWALVEAAGIEPASRDISVQASTCVVG